MEYVIIGTAGHVDHGKTALITSLTGIDIQRKEERERGMTINLGFTYFKLPSNKTAGIIDVPGHEKFLKNMLAGIGGIDLVLFVVAADEGVMPQTREHLDVMNLINIHNGIIVVTKADLVDEELLLMAKEDIQDAVKGTFLETAPMVVVSNVNSQGIDELTKLIDETVQNIKPRSFSRNVRLPVDRVFIKSGFGTVITGTLLGGTIKAGDNLEVLPSGIKTRIRSIQIHNTSYKEAFAGQRVALNLVGIDSEKIERGHVITAPGSFSLTDTIECRVNILQSIDMAIENNMRIVLYINTSEVFGRIINLDNKELFAGDSGYVRIKLEEPVVADFDDRFVIRLYSPRITVGGGVILSPYSLIKKPKALDTVSLLNDYENKNFTNIVYTLLRITGVHPLNKKELAKRIPHDYLPSILDELYKKGEIIYFTKEDSIMLKATYDQECQKILNNIGDFYSRYPWKTGISHSELASTSNSSIFENILDFLKENNKIEIINKVIKLAGYEPILNDPEQKILNEIKLKIEQSNFIDKSELKDRINSNYIDDFLYLLKTRDEIIQLSTQPDEIFVSKNKFSEFSDIITAFIKKEGSISMNQSRDILNTTRKYCVPFMEYLDSAGLTRRVENVRVLK